MREITTSNFGLLIAYLLPGFVTLWGVSFLSETVATWLGASPADAPTVGGFLYVTIGSVGAGLTASVVRWLVIDTFHHWTGVARPELDFSRLQENVAGFSVLIDIHYKYYQFYANSIISLAFAYASWRIGNHVGGLGWPDVGYLALLGIFFVGSRDTLRKYYTRSSALLKKRD